MNESYATALVTDGTVVKGRRYPIFAIGENMIHMWVGQKKVCVSADDEDFEFVINRHTK
jgi:hypothetical protein